MWRRSGTRPALAAVVAAALVALQLVAPVSGLADAANPVGATAGTETLNADGSVSIVLGGSWTWSGQKCSLRYGIGWAVDWWGPGTTNAPGASFSLTNATVVAPTGPMAHPWAASAVSTGTASYAGSLRLGGKPPSYFHVGAAYAGEDTNLCAQTLTDGTPYGSWSAAATYPSRADVQAALCVNLYDEHGSAGKSSGNAKDFSPTGDTDNSIQTNDYNPAIGGSCTATSSLTYVDDSGPNL